MPLPASADLLILGHEPATFPGLLEDWAAERGHTVDFRRLADNGLVELPDPGDYRLVVILGSRFSAYEEHEWLERELAYLRAAVAADRPLLGICFGAQLLARALGAEVRPGERAERGWYSVDTDAPDLIPAGPWVEWHKDVFDPPPGAELLARSAAGPQAFRHGRALGVQFHPEATPERVRYWCGRDDALLRAAGADPAAIVAETGRHAAAARERAFALFDGVLAAPR